MESAESAFCKYYFENKQKQGQVLVLVSLMQGGSFFCTVWLSEWCWRKMHIHWFCYQWKRPKISITRFRQINGYYLFLSFFFFDAQFDCFHLIIGKSRNVGHMKSSTPRTNNSVGTSPGSRPKSMMSSTSGSRAQYSNSTDQELSVQMTEFGFRRVKKTDDGSYGMHD